MRWVQVRVTPSRAPEGIAALLFSEGASCLQEDGVTLVTSFPEDKTLAGLQNRIFEADSAARVEVGAPSEPGAELHGTVAPHVIGALVVTPPWDADGFDPATRIVIEPAGAFGTGEHATTRGALRLIQKTIRNNDVVADLGAGSAVLAIAAAKLGAKSVAAIELDPGAIINAQDNVARNDVASVVKVIEGDAAVLLPLLSPVTLIVANIISGVLIELLPPMHAALGFGGRAILSGVLQSERQMLLEALADGGWDVLDEDFEDEWWSVLTVPR